MTNPQDTIARLRELLAQYQRFAGETAGACLGLAMSTEHPAPDEVLMGIFGASQKLAGEARDTIAALSVPNHSSVGREAVARIIDPERWALIDHWRAKLPTRPDLQSRIDDNAGPSLRKADAILALLPSVLAGVPVSEQRGRGERETVLRNFAGMVEIWLEQGPNVQPHYPDGMRPWSTGDLKALHNALQSVLSAPAVPAGVSEDGERAAQVLADAVIARVETWLVRQGGFSSYADRVKSGATGWSQLRSNIWLAVHSLASPSPDTPEKRMLLDLLAVIHRDGGHYTDEHGLAASVADAMLLSSERLPDTPEIEGRGQ